VQRRLLDRLAVEMLGGNIKDGDTVRVDAKGGDIVINARQEAAVG
jgi:hypothetical protein